MTAQWPSYLQKKLYPARFDRQLIDDIFTPGVRSVSDLVATADAGARAIDITAGATYVEGTQDDAQGSYRMLYEADVVEIDHCVSFPRLDQVISRIYDSEYGGIIDDGTLEILKGTETSGATLVNRLGAAPTLPANSILLYDVIAPVGSGVLSGGDIADRRVFANSRNGVSGGTSIISTSESITSTTFSTMPTPDQVASIVLPTDGLIAVWYQARWLESVAGAARAAIFVGSNQLAIALDNSAPELESAATNNSSGGIDQSLSTFHGGLVSQDTFGVTGADVTTGQVVGMASVLPYGHGVTYEVGSVITTVSKPVIVGGACYIFAAAGTYTISVQVKSSSGSVTMLDRKLWVRVL